MRFRNSFRLLLDNFKNTYVILLFRAIIVLITGALTGVILTSSFGFLTDSAEIEAIVEAFKDILATFFNSASYADFDLLFREAIETLVAAFGDLLLLLQAHIGGIVLSALGLVGIYLVNRFLNGLALFAFGDILHDKMSQYADTPFFVGFFTNIGSAALYQIVYVPIAFAFDVLSVVLCYLIFFRLFSFMPVLLALFLGVTFLIAMQAVKLAFISDWMPAIIVDGKKLGEAMRGSFRMGWKRFAANFSNYLMACYCILAVNVVFAVSTFFSALLITIPASYLFLISLQFVGYYETNKKRFFLSYRNIYDPTIAVGGFLVQPEEDTKE